jgi:hypothetical protein
MGQIYISGIHPFNWHWTSFFGLREPIVVRSDDFRDAKILKIPDNKFRLFLPEVAHRPLIARVPRYEWKRCTSIADTSDLSLPYRRLKGTTTICFLTSYDNHWYHRKQTSNTIARASNARLLSFRDEKGVFDVRHPFTRIPYSSSQPGSLSCFSRLCHKFSYAPRRPARR